MTRGPKRTVVNVEWCKGDGCEVSLACGHKVTVPEHQSPKIGTEWPCRECKGRPALALQAPPVDNATADEPRQDDAQ